MMTPERICVRDRRMAAVHEAGHIVTARALGFEVLSAWIGKNEGEVVERTWIGDVRLHLEKADDVSRRMVGVAGSVAAHLSRGGFIEDYCPEDEGSMSRSDWQMAGCAPNVPDDLFRDAVGEVGRLLARDGAGWKELIAESRRLIFASRPPAQQHRLA
jgi:hypothetical protein